MIVFRFGPEDLGRVRFALSPAIELVSSLDALREPIAHPIHEPWAREAQRAVRELDFRLIDAAMPEYGYCYRPDFVLPPPQRPATELEPELERVAATPREQVARELGWAYPKGLPPNARPLLDGRLGDLASDMRAYWELAIAPHWPQVKTLLEADLAARASEVAANGPLAALSDLHRDIAWRDGALELRRPYEETVELDGRGLLLIPSAFAWPRTWAMFDVPWPPAIVYPARGVGELWAPRETPGTDALAALIGRRRAEILSHLPASTRELAERLKASPGGISEHLGVLKDAGLIHGRREGREVRYVRTDAGDALIPGP